MHTGYLSLQTHTQNMFYLLLFRGKSDFTNSPQCCVYAYIACVVLQAVRFFFLDYYYCICTQGKSELSLDGRLDMYRSLM